MTKSNWWGRLALVVALALTGIATEAQAVSTLYFIHVDHLNTPRLVADATGTTVWRWDQAEPFGNNSADENPSGLGAFDLPVRLPGQYFDKETNLHYNYFRDYDPSLGRYGQSDPIGLRGGLNTYFYASGSPVVYIDPRGDLFFIPVVIAALTGGTAAATTTTTTVMTLVAIGATVGAVSGAIQTGNTVGWCSQNAAQIAGSAALGGLLGGATGGLGATTSWATGAIVGGISGFGGNLLGQIITSNPGDPINWQQAGYQGAVGVFSGMAAIPALSPLKVTNPAVPSAVATGAASMIINSGSSTSLGGFGYSNVVK